MINKQKLFGNLPLVDFSVQQVNHNDSNEVIVVLDDDPTGTQTVHNVPVITDYSVETLSEAFDFPAFFILTNSRSLTEQKAYELIYEITKQVQQVASDLGKSFQLICRGDSTLRGHFKIETRAVIEALHWTDALTIFVPAFFEGGRYTVNNIHYVEENGQLTPASETPFAKDSTFGFNSSELYQYILDKDPDVSRSGIFDLSIEEIRQSSIEELTAKINSNSKKNYLIINATDHADLIKVSHAIKDFKQSGKHLLIRSAAGLVPALAGIEKRALITSQDLQLKSGAGLIVIGSYVPKTTEQLQFLLDNHDLEVIELAVERLISADKKAYIALCTERLNDLLKSQKDCVIFTSRKLISGSDGASSLSIVNEVSQGVIDILNGLETQPSFVVAKGGITSSDVATKVLNIKKANVLGQILPGVPVWEPDVNSKYPCVPYVIFPGNVGNKSSLSDMYKILTTP